MRIVKQRLLEMLPDALVFLDVDDLQVGRGAEYLDKSAVVLILVSEGYFNSPNCMRELLRAFVTGKPIVVLAEPDSKKGGMTSEQVMQQLREAEAPYKKHGEEFPSKYVMWGLAREVEGWGYHMPSADVLHTALFDVEPIEWIRIGKFQDVSMRLIAEAILPEPLDEGTYLQGELSRVVPTLPAPRDGCSYHVYCSTCNAGAAELMREAAAQCNLRIAITENADDLGESERMLVYLTGLTWTSGEATVAFVEQIKRAMAANVPLLLCHEMPGIGGQTARHACDFDLFFSNTQGATPQELLSANIYSTIAVPLKGGAWRAVSMVMVSQALGASIDAGNWAPPGIQAEISGYAQYATARRQMEARSKAPAMTWLTRRLISLPVSRDAHRLKELMPPHIEETKPHTGEASLIRKIGV